MDNNDDLHGRIDRVLSECNEILRTADEQLKNCTASSFKQAKEIDDTVMRLKRKGLPVPSALTELKLKLVTNSEEHERLLSLIEDFGEKIVNLLSHPVLNSRRVSDEKDRRQRTRRASSPNYERPLGVKGNNNVEDYLIPVIKLMNEGHDYTAAFHKVANMLDVRYNTVSSQCTRALSLTTEEFVSKVKTGRIIDLLKSKYPDHVAQIKRELLDR
jgi:hypothetical protein